MVVVQPGIQVVPDVEEEVFFTNGYYWCRHDDGWYRTRDVRRGWYYMDEHRVPPGLTRMPPGKSRSGGRRTTPPPGPGIACPRSVRARSQPLRPCPRALPEKRSA